MLTNYENFWKNLLLAIPKNLVYIFVGIIAFAFCGMSYLTYTENGMSDFLAVEHTSSLLEVNPLFLSLRKSIQEYSIGVEADLSVKDFNVKYLVKNKPVV